MPVRTNRYYNDPSLGAAFENLASLFIDSPQDTLAMENARQVKQKRELQAEIARRALAPDFNKEQFDRLNAGVGNWTPSQGYYGVDTTAATARRGQDITAATELEKARLGEKATTFRTLMAPLPKDSVRPALPQSVADLYGMPSEPQYGVMEVGRGSTLITPDGRTIEGQQVPMTVDQIAGVVAQQELPNMTPLERKNFGRGVKPTETGQLLAEKGALPPGSPDAPVYERALAAKSRAPYEGTDEKNLAEYRKSIFDNASSAFADRDTYSAMAAAIDNPNVDQGTLGRARLGLRKALNAFGIPGGDTSDAEMLNALGNQMALRLRDPSKGAGMPGAMSDADRQFLTSMSASLGNSPEANRKLVSTYMRIAQKNIDLERLAQDYERTHNGGLDAGFRSVVTDYLTKNGLPPELAGGVASAAPAPGVQTAPPSPAAPAAPAASAPSAGYPANMPPAQAAPSSSAPSSSSSAPPEVATEQAYRALPSGALFTAPDGTVRRKP